MPIVPMRRLHSWATKVGVDFILDPTVPVPDNDTLRSKPIESAPKGGSNPAAEAARDRGKRQRGEASDDSAFNRTSDQRVAEHDDAASGVGLGGGEGGGDDGNCGGHIKSSTPRRPSASAGT